MAKETIISTSAVNCYGTRILTEGIDISQYERNPVLLWMHERSGKDRMPIGRMENLRRDGDKLIGTPVFDEKDDFAVAIADKWERGFLRMVSMGIEILETSADIDLIMPGQTRETITKCRLEEVSIVDIGANDDALQLQRAGKILTLSQGGDDDMLPQIKNNQNNTYMIEQIKQTLELSAEATDEEVLSALRTVCREAKEARTMELQRVTDMVDGAIAERRITAQQKSMFLELGKTSGSEVLRQTLAMIPQQGKPSSVIREQTGGQATAQYAKLSDMPEEEIAKLKEEQPSEYARLYKAEYGVSI